MTTPNDIARRPGGPDPDEVRSQVRVLLGELDPSPRSESELQSQAQLLEQAHEILVRALEAAEQG